MEKRPTSSRGVANEAYRPITEGYQPGSQLIQRGFTPPASRQPPPPRGGSNAMKPGSSGTAASKK